jgi:hypothetical protein
MGFASLYPSYGLFSVPKGSTGSSGKAKSIPPAPEAATEGSTNNFI